MQDAAVLPESFARNILTGRSSAEILELYASMWAGQL